MQTLIENVLLALIGAIVILVGGAFALQVVVRLIAAIMKQARIKPSLIDLARAAVVATGWIIILASVLNVLGLNQIALALGGSITLVALGIATAASGNLGDIIAGVFLASDPDFGTGFTITHQASKDDLPITGIIERIDLRKTRIRTADGKLHVIPNKAIESTQWVVEMRPANKPGPSLPQLPSFPFPRPRKQAGEDSSPKPPTPTEPRTEE